METWERNANNETHLANKRHVQVAKGCPDGQKLEVLEYPWLQIRQTQIRTERRNDAAPNRLFEEKRGSPQTSQKICAENCKTGHQINRPLQTNRINLEVSSQSSNN